jgi:hypothetical protein
MPSTLNPTCPLCGLRFGNKPLLDLHIREDHRERAPRAQNGHRDTGSTRAPASGADSPPGGHDLAATPSRTSKKTTARTTTHGRRAGRAMTAMRRALRALRHVNRELRRAQAPSPAPPRTAAPPAGPGPP